MNMSGEERVAYGLKYVTNARGLWVQVLQAWCAYNYYDLEIPQDILNQILWYNSHIRVGDEPIKWNAMPC